MKPLLICSFAALLFLQCGTEEPWQPEHVALSYVEAINTRDDETILKLLHDTIVINDTIFTKSDLLFELQFAQALNLQTKVDSFRVEGDSVVLIQHENDALKKYFGCGEVTLKYVYRFHEQRINYIFVDTIGEQSFPLTECLQKQDQGFFEYMKWLDDHITEAELKEVQKRSIEGAKIIRKNIDPYFNGNTKHSLL